MIPADSFLKNIPRILDLRQRLLCEGMAWVIDSIFWSYESIRQYALSVDPVKINDARQHIIHGLFVNCWSIVDQCHMLRRLLERLSPVPGGKTQAFLDRYEAATLIRNTMDHLDEKIGNLAASKGDRPPIFGALSYCLVGPDDLDRSHEPPQPTGCTVVTLTAGSFTHKTHTSLIINPVGRILGVPIGCIDFQAFEHEIRFSDLVRDIHSLLEHFDAELWPSVIEQIRAFARDNGLDEDRVLKEKRGGGLRLSMKMKFV